MADSSNGCLKRTGSNMNEKAIGDSPRKAVPENVPHIVDIKKAIPKHCFGGDMKTSFYYVFKDLSIICGLYVAMLVVEMQPFTIVKYAYTPVYWFLQGTMMWAIFVLGHDCGHESFSNNTLVNDIVGNALHSMILVPYYPWKLSHRHHHKNTGSIDRDEIFYPVRQKIFSEKEDNKPKAFLPLFAFGVSWFVYLFLGYSPRPACHFNPWDKLFVTHAIACGISVACLAAWSCVLWSYWCLFGFLPLLVHYLIPVFVFASWLVVVTFLHHQDVNVPWYSDNEWDFVKGNLSSVDRHYGWAHELTHNIGTHQVHHLFTKIPHYRLEEANAAFGKAFPHLTKKSSMAILPSFFKMFYIFESQRLIPDDTEIHVYREPK